MYQTKKSTAWPYWLLVIALILIDQASKIYVKTHFYMGEDLMVIPNWFRLSFTENQGVAFGMEWGGVTGKYFLSVFRIVFSSVLGILLYKAIKSSKYPVLLLVAGSLIFSGAIGNVIDGVFYGQVFSASSFHMLNIAEMVPFGQGYAPLLQGKVVDMLYFPLFEGFFPEWMPIYGGQHFIFFNAIFNVADTCISVGLVLLLWAMRKIED